MKPKALFINPFVAAVCDVLEAELQDTPVKGRLRMERAHYTTSEVTIIVGVSGQITGVVLYGMSHRTALSIARHMVRQVIPIFDPLAASAIAELGNMVTGRASVYLEEAGYTSKLTPPAVVHGYGTIISLRPFQRVVIPFSAQLGEIVVSVTLKETATGTRITWSPETLDVDRFLVSV